MNFSTWLGILFAALGLFALASLLRFLVLHAFLKAAYEGDEAKLKGMLRWGLSPNAQLLKQAALLEASCSPNPRVVEILLAAGADPNQRSRSGSTPLIAAASSGNFEAVRILLAAGAAVNAPGGDDHTPLESALTWAGFTSQPIAGYQEVVTLLLAAGASTDRIGAEDLDPERRWEAWKWDARFRANIIAGLGSEPQWLRPLRDDCAEEIAASLKQIARQIHSARLELAMSDTEGSVP